MNVLVFVPRQDVKKRIRRALLAAQFVVETANSHEECAQASRLAGFDGILVDSDSLVPEDVLSLVNVIKGAKADVVLFILVPYQDLEHRLRLYDAGVDDCVPEPFFATETAVRLRLHIQLRSAASKLMASSHLIKAGVLELDLIRRTVCRSGRTVELRPKEFLLLEYLVKNANHYVTRSMLLEAVWNRSFEDVTNVVDVYISSLRRKIDGEFNEKLIQTSRGMGYTLLCGEDDAAASRALSIPKRHYRPGCHRLNFPI